MKPLFILNAVPKVYDMMAVVLKTLVDIMDSALNSNKGRLQCFQLGFNGCVLYPNLPTLWEITFGEQELCPTF